MSVMPFSVLLESSQAVGLSQTTRLGDSHTAISFPDLVTASFGIPVLFLGGMQIAHACPVFVAGSGMVDLKSCSWLCCLATGGGHLHSRAAVPAAQIHHSLQPSPIARVQVSGARLVHTDGWQLIGSPCT